MTTLLIILAILVALVFLRIPPVIDGKNYWGFHRPRVRPALSRLGIDHNGQIYLKAGSDGRAAHR